jgi:hypothetical protein
MNEPRKIYVYGKEADLLSARVTVHKIQVRKGIPLPEVGDRVVALDEHRLVKFAGSVITVNQVARTYDVELRASMVTPAHECSERDSFAGRTSSDPKEPIRNEVRRVV